MYNEQIEKLIELALADGELTEKEKQVLFKKAEAAGIDLDEFEMVLEARLFEKTKHKTIEPTVAPKSDKLGDVKKCPACGAIATSFSASCSDCGFEFRNVGANTSVKLLSEKLEAVVQECNKMSFEDKNVLGKLTDTAQQQQEKREKEILDRQRDVIKNFPIPNTKEDILEFLHFMNPKIKTGFGSDKNVVAWRNKYTEVLSRAESAFVNDTKMRSEIEQYKQQYKSSKLTLVISWFIGLPKKAKTGIIVATVFVLFYGFMGIFLGGMSSTHDKEVEKEKERLELILQNASNAIQNKNYDEAEIFANQLYWEYTDSYTSNDTDKLTETWNEKREKILNTIQNLKDKR